ncbi:Serine/Threonine protein kinases active-site signature [Nakaseomyces glabratus]|nr:Serine/Threonine protein kinases active-site signature [Nakaseomyces glabratus]
MNSPRQLITHTIIASIYRVKDLAVKIVSTEHHIPPHNVQRERRILRKLAVEPVNQGYGAHVIKLIEDQCKNSNIELWFKFYPIDLEDYLRSCFKPQNKFNPYYTLGEVLETSLRSSYVNEFDVNEFAKDFFLQIVKGLNFIHQSGIIHRDIKPRNIVLEKLSTGKFNLVLIDFGISYDITETNIDERPDSKITDVSTSIYKAPELLFGVKNYSSAVDIWAMLVILSNFFSLASDCKNYLSSCFDDGYRPGEEDGSDIKLIFSIFEKFGVPTANEWPEVINHGSSEVFNGFFGNSDTSRYIMKLSAVEQRQIIASTFPRIEELSDTKFKNKLYEILVKMASYESTCRITALEILQLLENNE